MKLSEHIPLTAIRTALESADKQSVIKEMAGILHMPEAGAGSEELLAAVYEREDQASTGIGEGVAVPHGRIDRPIPQGILISFGLKPDGIDFEAIDGKAAQIFFLIVAGTDGSGLLLKALARISRLVRNRTLRDALIQCTTAEQVHEVLRTDEQLHFS